VVESGGSAVARNAREAGEGRAAPLPVVHDEAMGMLLSGVPDSVMQKTVSSFA
jgi:hypothetical protein